MVPGRKTIVAPGESGRAAAAGLVQWKDSPKSSPNVIPINTVQKGWRNQVGQTIERKPLAKRRKPEVTLHSLKTTNTASLFKKSEGCPYQ